MNEENKVNSSQLPAENVVSEFNKRPLVGKFNASGSKDLVMVIAAVVVVGFGILTGWLLSEASKDKNQSKVAGANVIKTKKEAGISDEKTFKDTAQGLLKEGGVNGEGTHHLERDGGPSQYVYLTSSVIDLDSFVGKNVQVWGETIKGAKAGWLMDVGKVKVLD
jgi:hypothetical protein